MPLFKVLKKKLKLFHYRFLICLFLRFRLHNVSSNALIPSWVPFAATKVSEEVLVFSLKLMTGKLLNVCFRMGSKMPLTLFFRHPTDDWMFERPSNQYFLGQFLGVEASVTQYNHVPLRLFVDSCVATAVPDVNSAPRYSFIENHGCVRINLLTSCVART